ncbi:MAG: hypothetical protein JW940_22545 [Polyangiaceae bacterium]|nr:hypothetical protein [Polyangiaceae bacterium]
MGRSDGRNWGKLEWMAQLDADAFFDDLVGSPTRRSASFSPRSEGDPRAPCHVFDSVARRGTIAAESFFNRTTDKRRSRYPWSIDAALMWTNKRAYFFKGDQYVRFSVRDDWVVRGYSKTIADHWPGVFKSDIDAAIMWPNGRAYFFKGDQYVAYARTPSQKFLWKRKIKKGWPGLFERDIDAAVMWDSTKAYFFKGDEYVEYRVGPPESASAPRKIKDDWDIPWHSGIDAAIKWPTGKAYFFKGREYIRVSSNKKVDADYPKPIADHWVARPWYWLPLSKRSAARRATRGNFPARPTESKKGRAFIAEMVDKDKDAGTKRPSIPVGWQARERAIYREIRRGNVPDALVRRLVTIDLPPITVASRTIGGSVKVMPDYLCVGDESDYVYVPMDPITAQRVAFELDMNLPTARICHAIYEAAGRIDVKRQLRATFFHFAGGSYTYTDDEGHTRTGRGEQNSTAAYVEHSSAIKERMAHRGLRLGDFVAGHKKDVILAQALHSNPMQIAFHGFYHPGNKKPVQPCVQSPGPGCEQRVSLGHTMEGGQRFSDYSQGVRLVSDDMIVDGKRWSMRKVLAHATLSKLISTEGRIVPPFIPEPVEEMLDKSQW